MQKFRKIGGETMRASSSDLQDGVKRFQSLLAMLRALNFDHLKTTLLGFYRPPEYRGGTPKAIYGPESTLAMPILNIELKLPDEGGIRQKLLFGRTGIVLCEYSEDHLDFQFFPPDGAIFSFSHFLTLRGLENLAQEIKRECREAERAHTKALDALRLVHSSVDAIMNQARRSPREEPSPIAAAQ